MTRTATRKRTTRSKPKAKQERIRVEEGLNTDCDWTPAEVKVHPRHVEVKIREKGKPAAEIYLAECGEAQGDGIVLLTVTCESGAKRNVGEFGDTMTSHDLDLIIEGLLVARERARAIGILPG